jgi:hypothetical protein
VELAETERALDALEARGARLFDAPTCGCVRTLIARAEELEGESARLLSERAADHLERLRARFERARAEAREKLARVERDHGVRSELRDLLEIGELVKLRRALRHLRQRPAAIALASRASSARKQTSEYEESLAELVASLALARAVDIVPKQAGPYNPLRIASELLARMQAVSPLYLTAQLNRLEELASLLSLPELPKAATKPAAKKRRALKS